MSLLSDAEHDAMLVALGGGDTATVDGTTVPCIIGGGDQDQLQDGGVSPVAFSVRALIVTVRTGALATLKAGSTVTLRGVAYTADRVQRLRNDSLTQFLAYPS